jgi:hypothetical protein
MCHANLFWDVNVDWAFEPNFNPSTQPTIGTTIVTPRIQANMHVKMFI